MTENEAINELTKIQMQFEMSITEAECGDKYAKEALKDNRNAVISIGTVISAIKEIQQYREIGTVEELKKAVKEEDVLKFYYCESEDDYYIGKRKENFYYARYGETGFEWFMSRYLPWGEHVVAPNTLWKEYTYPSEPKEIPFFEWLQGFLKKYCGGTVEECREAVKKSKSLDTYVKQVLWERDIAIQQLEEIGISFGENMDSVKEAVEKQKPKKPNIFKERFSNTYSCQKCGYVLIHRDETGWFCGQHYKFCPKCGQAIRWDENLEGMEDEQKN